jgi:hypothetical protein
MLASAALLAETKGQTTYLKGNSLRKFKFKGKSVSLKGNGSS